MAYMGRREGSGDVYKEVSHRKIQFVDSWQEFLQSQRNVTHIVDGAKQHKINKK